MQPYYLYNLASKGTFNVVISTTSILAIVMTVHRVESIWVCIHEDN